MAVAVGLGCAAGARPATASGGGAELARLERAFADQTGAHLVFARADLPRGAWYDRMPELPAARRVAAARILVAEARKYPRGWLGAIGLHQVGVFDALVSTRDDGYHVYDRRRGGYLYYGMWNGAGALAAAYYTDGQLPLTFHHEAFHHVDGTRAGVTGGGAFGADDARFGAAVAGTRRYPALAIAPADLRALERAAGGEVLRGAVGDYAGKAPGEDQAETARWLMSHLAAGLVQAATRPELPGSQRILHVLAGYRAAGPAPGDGPDAAWLVDVALGRDAPGRRLARDGRAAVAALAARIAPRGEPGFVVWGREQADGANWILRADVARFGVAGERVAAEARRLGAADAALAEVERELAGMLARYRGFVAARWSVTAGTARAFDQARARIERVTPGRAPARTNPYLHAVDDAIADPGWRAAIRAVQPATVKLGGGSGVNLAASGVVLTAGHVAGRLGARLTVRFPDGASYPGRTVAYDADLDLAVLVLDGARDLPWAPIAAAPPVVGDPVCVIGQPGTADPGRRSDRLPAVDGVDRPHPRLPRWQPPRQAAPGPDRARRLDLLGPLGQPAVRQGRRRGRAPQQLGLDDRDASRRDLGGDRPRPRRRRRRLSRAAVSRRRERLARAAELRPRGLDPRLRRAAVEVVVDQPHRLHERVDRGRADEAPAAALEVPGERVRRGRVGQPGQRGAGQAPRPRRRRRLERPHVARPASRAPRSARARAGRC